MRWVVGDIHGCAGAFERLLEAIRFDPSRDELWSVGDLVNTGPDSAAVLRLWRATGGRGVLGNHDIHALRVRAGSRKRRKEDTLDDLLGAVDAGELLASLRSLPILVRLPGGRQVREAWIVHAGLHPDWSDLPAVAGRINALQRDDAGPLRPEIAFATRARCCLPSGEMLSFVGPPGECPSPHRPWDDFYRGEALVVHGHWARRGHYRGERTIGLDSGCVYGGPLSAWCQEEDRVVQVR
jgi:bis(5'-nucleosyl)-tetraphosphatase (symmetrical)